jgi:hypothetical protein
MSSQATTANDSTIGDIPNWSTSGDWFDVCKCNIPCPCTFAQTPTYGDCDGIIVYHIKEGNYDEISLSGLNVLILDSFKGNPWADHWVRVNAGIFFDEKANEQQRIALNMIFSGRAGGFMAEFAKLLGEVQGIEYVPIKFEIADDLSYWSAEIPGKILAKAEALSGSTTPPGKRVQTINPPGSEVGAGAIATWGKSTVDQADAMGFKWERNGKSSKHFSFHWRGP